VGRGCGSPDPAKLMVLMSPKPHDEDGDAPVHPTHQRLSKKIEHHAAAVSLHFLYYNFGRVHQSLANPYPRTPAMAAGVSDHVWTLEGIAGLLD
jgi:hypothetical protein